MAKEYQYISRTPERYTMHSENWGMERNAVAAHGTRDLSQHSYSGAIEYQYNRPTPERHTAYEDNQATEKNLLASRTSRASSQSSHYGKMVYQCNASQPEGHVPYQENQAKARDLLASRTSRTSSQSSHSGAMAYQHNSYTPESHVPYQEYQTTERNLLASRMSRTSSQSSHSSVLLYQHSSSTPERHVPHQENQETEKDILALRTSESSHSGAMSYLHNSSTPERHVPYQANQATERNLLASRTSRTSSQSSLSGALVYQHNPSTPERHVPYQESQSTATDLLASRMSRTFSQSSYYGDLASSTPEKHVPYQDVMATQQDRPGLLALYSPIAPKSVGADLQAVAIEMLNKSPSTSVQGSPMKTPNPDYSRIQRNQIPPPPPQLSYQWNNRHSESYVLTAARQEATPTSIETPQRAVVPRASRESLKASPKKAKRQRDALAMPIQPQYYMAAADSVARHQARLLPSVQLDSCKRNMYHTMDRSTSTTLDLSVSDMGAFDHQTVLPVPEKISSSPKVTSKGAKPPLHHPRVPTTAYDTISGIEPAVNENALALLLREMEQAAAPLSSTVKEPSVFAQTRMPVRTESRSSSASTRAPQWVPRPRGHTRAHTSLQGQAEVPPQGSELIPTNSLEEASVPDSYQAPAVPSPVNLTEAEAQPKTPGCTPSRKSVQWGPNTRGPLANSPNSTDLTVPAQTVRPECVVALPMDEQFLRDWCSSQLNDTASFLPGPELPTSLSARMCGPPMDSSFSKEANRQEPDVSENPKNLPSLRKEREESEACALSGKPTCVQEESKPTALLPPRKTQQSRLKARGPRPISSPARRARQEQAVQAAVHAALWDGSIFLPLGGGTDLFSSELPVPVPTIGRACRRLRGPRLPTADVCGQPGTVGIENMSPARVLPVSRGLDFYPFAKPVHEINLDKEVEYLSRSGGSSGNEKQTGSSDFSPVQCAQRTCEHWPSAPPSSPAEDIEKATPVAEVEPSKPTAHHNATKNSVIFNCSLYDVDPVLNNLLAPSGITDNFLKHRVIEEVALLNSFFASPILGDEPQLPPNKFRRFSCSNDSSIENSKFRRFSCSTDPKIEKPLPQHMWIS